MIGGFGPVTLAPARAMRESRGMTAAYPALRLRRTRASGWSRRLHAENTLTPADLIWPLFVTDGQGVEEPIAALPGVSRWSLDEVESLETQLTAQLELVRQQKAAMLAAAAENAPYRRAFVREDGLDLDSVLAPECAQIIRRGGIAKNRAAFLRLRECYFRCVASL